MAWVKNGRMCVLFHVWRGEIGFGMCDFREGWIVFRGERFGIGFVWWRRVEIYVIGAVYDGWK
jgi:hypothetical protein